MTFIRFIILLLIAFVFVFCGPIAYGERTVTIEIDSVRDKPGGILQIEFKEGKAIGISEFSKFKIVHRTVNNLRDGAEGSFIVVEDYKAIGVIKLIDEYIKNSNSFPKQFVAEVSVFILETSQDIGAQSTSIPSNLSYPSGTLSGTVATDTQTHKIASYDKTAILRGADAAIIDEADFTAASSYNSENSSFLESTQQVSFKTLSQNRPNVEQDQLSYISVPQTPQAEPHFNSVYRLNDVDTKPSFVVVQRPEFPETLISLVPVKGADSIVFEAEINQAGILENIVVLESPSAAHSQALIDALADWVATPGKISGHPVRTKIRQRIELR